MPCSSPSLAAGLYEPVRRPHGAAGGIEVSPQDADTMVPTALGTRVLIRRYSEGFPVASSFHSEHERSFAALRMTVCGACLYPPDEAKKPTFHSGREPVRLVATAHRYWDRRA